MLSMGFLTKGFVAFTPLALPFFMWLFLRNNRFLSMVSDSVLVLISTALPLILIYLFTGAHESLPEYIDMASYKISKGVTASSRFYIFFRLLMELLPALGIILVFMIYNWKNRLSFNNMRSNLSHVAVFFALGMAGVLPILSTMDQSTYFVLLSLPFFAISLGLLLNPFVEVLLEKINYNSLGYRLFKFFGVIALSSGIILSIYFSKSFNRDEYMLKDMEVILPKLTENITINILPEMRQNWSLYAYYARYKNISLDPDLNNKHDYLLITTSLYSDTINNGFERIYLNTKEYELFKRKFSDTR